MRNNISDLTKCELDLKLNNENLKNYQQTKENETEN